METLTDKDLRDVNPAVLVTHLLQVAVYGISGYHVGSVELMTRIIAQLCAEA